MQTAHDLARYAAMVADYIDLEQIESFATEHDMTNEWVRVTFRLTNGSQKRYLVRVEKEEDTPAGESHPDSPLR